MKDERKRSAGSNGSGNSSHKKNSKDSGRDQLLHLKCKYAGQSNREMLTLYKVDQNFEKMDGIVNRDYYKSNSPAPTSATAILPSTLHVPSTTQSTPSGMDTTVRTDTHTHAQRN